MSINIIRYRYKSLKELILSKLVENNPSFKNYVKYINSFTLRKNSLTNYTIDFTNSINGIRYKKPAIVDITINQITISDLFINKLNIKPNIIEKRYKQEVLDNVPETTITSYDDPSDTIIIRPYNNFNIGDTIIVDDTTSTYILLTNEYKIPLITKEKMDIAGMSRNNTLSMLGLDYIEPRDDI